jgi:ABC-type antimicrobial peptide transport system permease subunit
MSSKSGDSKFDAFTVEEVPKISFVEKWRRRIRDAPENIRLASQSAWRGRERGLAVVAGVFLASLVITTVLSYGVGLSQIFFDESLSGEPIDAKVEYAREPVEGVSGWSNNTTTMQNVCTELMEKYSDELSDCALIFGRQGIHSGGFFNEDFVFAQPLEMRSITDDQNPYWLNVTFNYPELDDGGPPISDMRSIRLMGPQAFDGELASRYGERIIQGQGEWPTPENMSSQRGVILPSNIASQAKAEVGDVLEAVEFVYVVDSEFFDSGGVELVESCPGVASASPNGKIYCRQSIIMTNMTVVGIYQPWDLGNPTLAPNPIFTTWTALDESQRATLMDYDHMYLGVTIDRSQLPTSSTADAQDWLNVLKSDIMADNYTSEGVELFYTDIVGGTITFLNIFLGLIQTFDYIIMVPIVVMSLAVLVYGLILSLEQRRKEISIHRVIGADSAGLQGMVLLELAVFSSVAWIAGYLLAMFSVPIVLSAVGFMEFRTGEYNIDPALSFGSTVFTALSTLGLAILFGRKRSQKFIELEIEEGVKSTLQEAEPKRWLHWLCFIFGLISVIDTWLEMNGSEDGIVSNFFFEGLLGIFGPFLLWIGGALLLGRIGAKGPQIMQLLFGRSRILKDVKRGLKGSGSTESVNRLAVIMLLTLSIVTLAAVQGYTGTLVDERTVDATVGSDVQVTFENPQNQSQALSIFNEIYDGSATAVATTVPSILLKPTDGGDTLRTWVILDDSDEILEWNEQSVPGADVSDALDVYSKLGFTAGEDSAYTLKLAGSEGGKGGNLDDVLLEEGDEQFEKLEFTWEEVSFRFINSTDDIDPFELFLEYTELMNLDLSDVDFSGQDLSYRNLSRLDFSGANLSGANLQGSNLSESILVGTNLDNANLQDTNMINTVIVELTDGSMVQANLTGANMAGLFGDVDFSQAILGNATCPDESMANETGCVSGASFIPTPLAAPIFAAGVQVEFIVTPHNITLEYMGIHKYIPGVSTTTIDSELIIGESSWRTLVGENRTQNHNSTTWIFKVDGVEDEDLETLGSNIEADSRVAGVIDWASEHKTVERNGGLIFGTPGLLSLQFVVASIAAVASSFVFLSLVLNQRKKELAVLQAIGASPNQILRLVLFEILSIVMVSMVLGLVLGIGLAFSFNGFFDVFGFIFGIFGGTSTSIRRELVYPWLQLGFVSLSVFAAVVMALLVTTRRALKSDLAMVLKGE